MKKNYLLLATAAAVMAGCANEEDLSINKSTSPTQGDGAIVFSMNTPNATRTSKEDVDAATALGKEFIVWGEKTKGTESGTAATADNIVFKNYRVQYGTGTANTTTSNTDDWEYVGLTPYKASTEANEAYVYPSILTDNASAKQTIKYWDDNVDSYTFTAVSAKQDDINGKKVKITKIQGVDNGTANDKGYTIELADATASVGDIYVADRKVISEKTNGSFSHSVVKLEFRNFQSKIRFGIYENVPGYRVVITGIKYNNGTADQVHESTGGTFGVEGNFVLAGAKTTSGTNTSYNVTYDANNHAQVSVTAGNDQSYFDTGGTNWLNTSFTLADQSNCIGETAATATYDKTTTTTTGTAGSTTTTVDKKAYTAILPNPGNTQNLKLQIKYDLYSIDNGEKISVGYKSVEVPAEYCTWKSNYAYTYLFKITDKSADLYPITFDACVVEETTGNQETITTVDKPSITTYVKGKTASDEYAGGDIIYAFAQDGTVTEMSENNMKLYKVETSDATTCPITEASVKNALEENTSVTSKKITVTPIESTGSESDKPSYEAIPREDTGDRTITGMKWTATAGTTYAVKYIKTETVNSQTVTTNYYKIVKVASGN